MKTVFKNAAAAVLASVIALTGVIPAQAQVIPAKTDVAPGERLSDWLMRQVGPNADTSALHWRVPAERATQDQLRRAAIQVLQHDPGIRLAPADRDTLADWLLALPLTAALLLNASPTQNRNLLLVTDLHE